MIGSNGLDPGSSLKSNAKGYQRLEAILAGTFVQSGVKSRMQFGIRETRLDFALPSVSQLHHLHQFPHCQNTTVSSRLQVSSQTQSLRAF